MNTEEPILFPRQAWGWEQVTPQLSREASIRHRRRYGGDLRCRYNECGTRLEVGQEVLVVRLKKSGKFEAIFCSASCQRRCWVDKRAERD